MKNFDQFKASMLHTEYQGLRPLVSGEESVLSCMGMATILVM